MTKKTVTPHPSQGAYSYGESDSNGISRNPNLLLPVFADKLEILFQRLKARGLDPYFYEGWRSPQRALTLANKGTGIVKSLHSYGAAADIISRAHYWDDAAFFTALGEEAEKLGLVWGGRFKSKPDLDHVQAVPATSAAQNGLMASNNPNDFAKKYIG